MPDIRQSSEYGRYLAQIGWTVERVKNTNYFIRKFPIIGSVLKIQRPEKIDHQVIKELQKKYKAFQIILEPSPYCLLPSASFRLSKSPYLPTKTLHIDISLSEKNILAGFRSDIQRAIKQFSINQFSNYQDNLEQFRKVWKKAVGLSKYVPSPKQLKALQSSFKDNSLFVTTSDESDGIIFLLSDSILYYWQAFSDKKRRYLPNQYRMVWYGILWGKKRGAKMFDFEGIYDSRFPNKSWLGFTHFKKSFGGKEVEYPGCFVKTKLIF
ncbi:MAG: peptidoglycan bridge formation glycyltransferase FemA/FemB family protein [Candidatus Microgenomates bacterium]|jgi:hypothetical protein